MIRIIRWSTWLNDDQMTKIIATAWCIDQTNHSGRKSSESNPAKLCKWNIKTLRSTTCEGQYCFISLTTSEIVLESASFKHNYEDHEEFIGINRPRYEILAGCLKVDDDRVRLCKNIIGSLTFQKVNVGCTTEYTANSTEPLSKHCICDTHLCNFHHLVAGTEDTRPRATKQQVVRFPYYDEIRAQLKNNFIKNYDNNKR